MFSRVELCPKRAGGVKALDGYKYGITTIRMHRCLHQRYGQREFIISLFSMDVRKGCEM
jgi:hypothetical protein